MKTSAILLSWLVLLGLTGSYDRQHYEPDTINLTTMTVDGTDYPVCSVEDCSDQPDGIGLWEDKATGNWWLSTGDESFLVIDDTAR